MSDERSAPNGISVVLLLQCRHLHVGHSRSKAALLRAATRSLNFAAKHPSLAILLVILQRARAWRGIIGAVRHHSCLACHGRCKHLVIGHHLAWTRLLLRHLWLEHRWCVPPLNHDLGVLAAGRDRLECWGCQALLSSNVLRKISILAEALAHCKSSLSIDFGG